VTSSAFSLEPYDGKVKPGGVLTGDDCGARFCGEAATLRAALGDDGLCVDGLMRP